MYLHTTLFIASVVTVTALQPLPPIYWSYDKNSSRFSMQDAPKTIYILDSFADRRDSEGLTLIPPSAYEFAQVFIDDLNQITSTNWTLETVSSAPTAGIILGPFRDTFPLVHEGGSPTEEGYELEISNSSVYIGGSGARGMFWGTRTVLQKMLISNTTSLAPGYTIDAPAYPTRGYMLDAGRKWYSPSFLKELCTYASFFKMNEFHYHTSDNYPLNRGRNSTWNAIYHQFSLHPETPSLHGLINRANETLSRADFSALESHCALRGVTIIPEIEAPGHSLAITKWKPELALPKKDLLNLSHPDAIPTVKAIWTDFLPWFHTKEVHIGADEYDPLLADDYINFVNTMSDFIHSTSGKRIRIWGTHEPSPTNLSISKDVIIQHWQYGQSDPIALQAQNYSFINSEDWWSYMSLKNDHTPIFPATYPQFFNTTRTLNFANVRNWQWEPSVFNPVNLTEQLKPGASGNKGAILAAWNDNGPDATTQLEAYYAMREGLPVAGSRMWSGTRGVMLDPLTVEESVMFLTARAPGQYLDRRGAFEARDGEGVVLEWKTGQEGVIGEGSYGPPYTLSLSVTGTFTLRGRDATLSLSPTPSNGTEPSSGLSLVFTTDDNIPYPLRSVSALDGQDPGHPGRIWTNLTTSPHIPVAINIPATVRIETDVVNGSRVWVNDSFAGRFEVFVYGGRNTLFSWSQMAFVAPLESVEGGVEKLVLEDGVGRKGVGEYEGPSSVASTIERRILLELAELFVLILWLV
ncbi:glycoside hydrolase family 20 protein [Sporormia fimetaria CBS 119925]|uniref:beta-N-acetylhexosaminidase n=1 Tax=Sporormia fimetaria CBS 119925 TaxID=1340428 RepID=A0A6A6VE29_9PLEO|nr:glycoside hydrolase family 20 protein [Sporormia fimetaria CBS 119925]